VWRTFYCSSARGEAGFAKHCKAGIVREGCRKTETYGGGGWRWLLVHWLNGAYPAAATGHTPLLGHGRYVPEASSTVHKLPKRAMAVYLGSGNYEAASCDWSMMCTSPCKYMIAFPSFSTCLATRSIPCQAWNERYTCKEIVSCLILQQV
jgi:hypothetical protein